MFLNALLGGMLIGLSAFLYLFLLGRVAGISGMLGKILKPEKNESAIAIIFLGGLILGYVILVKSGVTQPFEMQRSSMHLLIAGFLVGLGTTLGNGCTSGHGICGMGRFSKRSIYATMTFMFFGFLTVFLTEHVF